MGLKRFGAVAALFILGVQSAFADFPPNDLYKQDNLEAYNARLESKGITADDMTEEKFNELTQAAIAVYKPFAKKAIGCNLVGRADWKHPEVNAYAERRGNTCIVQMFGGLARRKEITLDGFSLVVCHEIGHHMGGFVLYPSDKMSAEGQADYFATQKCARKLWSNEPNINAEKAQRLQANKWVSEVALEKCNTVFSGNIDAINLCIRQAAAGQSLANLLSFGGKKPDYSTPDPTVVKKTKVSHPQAQCRLDTYIAGALCNKAIKSDIWVDNEKEDIPWSCTEAQAYPALQVRSRCWYKPTLVHDPLPPTPGPKPCIIEADESQ